MATWMTHLRVGDLMFKAIGAPWLDPQSFAFGSVAPDCGIALPDGRYDPSKETTHYGHSDDRDYARFARENLTGVADDRTFSFYLGYYLHIVTDAAWVRTVYRAQLRAFRDLFESDAAFNAAIKAEWDALDFRFLRESDTPRLLEALMATREAPAILCPFIRRDALEAQFVRTVEKYGVPFPPIAPTQYLRSDELDEFIEAFTRRLRTGMDPSRDGVWWKWHESASVLPSASFHPGGWA